MKKDVALLISIAIFFILILGILAFYSFQKPNLSPEDFTDRRVVFHPNTHSVDIMELFSDPTQWEVTRQNIDYFGFYMGTVLPDPWVCPDCHGTTLDNFLAVDAFNKLTQWGIEAEIEVPVIKVGFGGCGLETTQLGDTIPVAYADWAADTIELHGGTAGMLKLDEPFYYGLVYEGGETCGYGVEESAIITADYIEAMKTKHPGIKIIETEPFPYLTVQQHKDWINALEAQLAMRGLTLDGYHLDVNRYTFSPDFIPRPQDIADLKDIKEFVEGKGIPYGLIYLGQMFPDFEDQVYYDSAMTWINILKANSLEGTDHIFQSWILDPNGLATIPTNIPETQPYTHTNLILDGLEVLLDQEASTISATIPTTTYINSLEPISITVRNTGVTNWYNEGGYKLKILGNNWGVNEVELDQNEIIASGGLKTFTFDITAPATSGTYQFEATLTHEGIEDFGETITRQIAVINPTPNISPITPGSIQNNVNRTVHFNVVNGPSTFVVGIRVVGQSDFIPYCSYLDTAICNIVGDQMEIVIPQGYATGNYEIAFVALYPSSGQVLESNIQTLTVQSTPVCSNGQTQACGVGVCAISTETCTNENWPGCEFMSIPNYQISETTCDSLDNDCDGATDEGCSVNNPNPSSSGGGGGGGGGGSIRPILPNIKNACEDGSDNDNDGQVDYPLDLGCSNKNDNDETDEVQTQTEISEVENKELEGQNGDGEIRVFFWSAVVLFLVVIALTIVRIVRIIKINRIRRLAYNQNRGNLLKNYFL